MLHGRLLIAQNALMLSVNESFFQTEYHNVPIKNMQHLRRHLLYFMGDKPSDVLE